MIANYDEEGLNMVDSRTQNKALKVKWLSKIKDNCTYESNDIWFQWFKLNIPDE